MIFYTKRRHFYKKISKELVRHIGATILNVGNLTMDSQSATSETPIYQFS